MTALESALQYARSGWAVHPLYEPLPDGRCSCGHNHDGKKIGKHPRLNQWQTVASTDPAKIRSWWKENPNANVGILTGSRSGIVVLDVDERDGGSKSLQNLTDQHGPLPETLTVSTGNGRHFYFQHSEPVGNRIGKLGSGLDFKGEGGYVVAPPSVHWTGKRYDFLSSFRQPAQLPVWLPPLLADSANEPRSQAAHSADARLMAILPQIVTIPEGIRNDSLASLGGLLRWAGLECREIEGLLLIRNTYCFPPLEPREVREIAKSMATYPRGLTRSSLYWHKSFPDSLLSSSSIQLLQDYQRGWLWMLMAHAWQHGGTLPLDLAALSKLAGASSRRKFQQESAPVLAEFVTVDVGGGALLVHTDLAAQYIHAVETASQNSKNGRRKIEKVTLSEE